MDELKQSVQLAVHEQKDPTTKFEPFGFQIYDQQLE